MSTQFVEIFNFLHLKTPIHRLDPRSKGIFLLCFIIPSFILDSIFLLFLLICLTIPLIILGKIGKKLMIGLKGLSFLLLLILVINTGTNSLQFALLIIFRILLLMIVFSIYFQTTSPEDLSLALISLKIPYPLAFSMSLAFRFVPTMAKETQIISDAQKSRGHRIEEGGPLTQMKNMIPLLVPLLMNSIRRAFHVAEALETRAFGVLKKPVPYVPLKFKLADAIFSIICLLIFIGVLFIHINISQFPAIFSYRLTL